MSSRALQRWQGEIARELDQIEAAHRAVGGEQPGRRFFTQQINHAYAVLLSSQFQRFCRDLHSEAVDHLASTIENPILLNLFRSRMIADRKLDRGNPSPGNLGSDFKRFGIEFWDIINGLDQRHAARQKHLETLGKWRNAIAHQDFKPAEIGRESLHLNVVKQWRSTCNALAKAFDSAVGEHLRTIMGKKAW